MKIGHILQYVSNVPATRKFYEQIIGLKVEYEAEHHAILMGANGVTLGLNATKPTGATASGIQVDFEVADVDAEYRCIQDLGFQCDPPITQPWGLRHLYLKDPDGRVVSIFSGRSSVVG